MNTSKDNRIRRGFTLLEILLVVALVAILAGIVVLAINPSKQLADARNAQRSVDVNTILNAVYQYEIDHNGELPAPIGDDSRQICQTPTNYDCSALVVMNGLTDQAKYLVKIPRDPSGCNAPESSCYNISKDANNRITVEAGYAENGAVIKVTR